MKHFWIMLLVVAVGIILAIPAGATPPLCSDNPNHPRCIPEDPVEPPPDEPLAGLTCAEAAPPPQSVGNVIFDCSGDCSTFDLVLEPKWNTCIDVESTEGRWKITVGEWGDAYEIAVAVQDSVAPGDACWGGCAGGGIITPDHPELLVDTPASTLDACGLDFGDGDPRLTFHAEARFRPPTKNDRPASITVTLPSPLTP